MERSEQLSMVEKLHVAVCVVVLVCRFWDANNGLSHVVFTVA
jgi:hypothetical protein